VAVHEVGRDGDTLYIVSDFVRGVTLADRLTAGPFSVREAEDGSESRECVDAARRCRKGSENAATAKEE